MKQMTDMELSIFIDLLKEIEALERERQVKEYLIRMERIKLNERFDNTIIALRNTEYWKRYCEEHGLMPEYKFDHIYI